MLKDKVIAAILKSWYEPKSKLTKLLRPLSRCYGKVLPLRARFYEKRQTRFPVPVVVVGNITVGGTGKTPLIIYLAEQLKAQGFEPGIVSRGYLGKLSKDFPVQVRDHHTADEVGDEPFMIYKRTRLPVMICRERVKAIGALLTIAPKTNVILSDDGLQHYAMGRDIEIIVVDGIRRFGNVELLPAGPLREPISRLKKVDFVVSQGKAGEKEYLLSLKGDKLFAVNNPGQQLALSEFEKMTVHAVAGIGHPERFFKSLSDRGLKVIPHAFPDHHMYCPEDLKFTPVAPIVMTEKDAVKCYGMALKDAWYLPVKAEIESDFINSLVRKLKNG